MMMAHRIGEVMPWEPPPGILGAELDSPAWFILTVMSQRERALQAKLARWGLEDTWFPVEEVCRTRRGLTACYERAIAPGYLFAFTTHEIVWHRLWERGRGYVTGVVGDEEPRVIPEAVIAKMRQVPKRIELLREQETAREKAARLARLPRVGDTARLTTGPLAGRLVRVERIDRGIAAFLMEGSIAGTADVEKLEREG